MFVEDALCRVNGYPFAILQSSLPLTTFEPSGPKAPHVPGESTVYVVIDECHHVSIQAYQAAVMRHCHVSNQVKQISIIPFFVISVLISILRMTV